MTDSIRSALGAATEYVAAHPDEARYTDSAATARLAEQLHVVVEGANGERVETDMVSGIGGLGVAPGPGWLYRAAVASCVASLVGMRAAQLALDGVACEITVDSESDDRGILGIDPSVPAGPLSVRITVAIRAVGADAAQLEEVARWAVDHCPVADVTRRLVPVRVEVLVG
jgi:uncharacterized OsmC-like protein